MFTKTFCLLIAFLKVFTFGAFLTNSGNLFHTGGTLLEYKNFSYVSMAVVNTQLVCRISSTCSTRKLKNVRYFRIVIINDLVCLYEITSHSTSF